MNQTHRTLGLAFALLAATSTLGCSSSKPKETPKAAAPSKVEKMPGEADLTTLTLTPEAEARLKVVTVAVEARDLGRTRTVGGEVVVPPGRAILVSSPIAGTLHASKLGLPTPGSKVVAGQVLFNLVPLLSSEARATFATSKVEIRGQVEQLEKQLAQAKVVLDRAERLRREKLGGAGAVEDARSGFDVAEAGLRAAQSRLAAIDQAIQGAEGGALEALPITVERAGTLRNLMVAPGQKVAAGASLFDVIDLDPVHVRVPIYVGDASKLDDARPAEVVGLSDSPGAATRPAKRVTDPPSGDPLAATVDLFFEVANKDGALRPGQRVGVTLPIQGTRSGLVVPRAALLRDVDGGTWVYESLGKHKFARRRVRVEAVVGDLASLLAGPKAGTLVVTDGAAELFGSEFGGSK